MLFLLILTAVLPASLFLSCGSDKKTRIEIISYLVRDRVIPHDTIEMRSTIIIAFKILPKTTNLKGLSISGKLYHNNILVSTDTISGLDSLENNLGFDLPLSHSDFDYNKPFGIPDGRYLIVIDLFDKHHLLLARGNKELMRNQLGRKFLGFDKIFEPTQYLEVTKVENYLKIHPQNYKPGVAGNKEFIVFQKNYLERVYPHTGPDDSEYIEVISAKISRDECQSLTFSLWPLKNLGRVQVSISSLKGKHGDLGADSLSIGTIGHLTEIIKKEEDTNTVYYRFAPKIIESKRRDLLRGYSQRYWLTLNVGTNVFPGDYNGIITINSQFGHQTKIPIRIRVLPFRLTDTNIQYGMMMTYAFYELDNDLWDKQKKDLIQKNGLKIYKNFREHGMTMVYPHSHFYLKRDANGKPVLSSLQASLEAYVKYEFPGPFCWYFGHFLQTAKPFHPGSIINYNNQVSKTRLSYFLDVFEEMAKELGIPKNKLIVQLVDEADRRDRVAAGKVLNKIARETGFKTLITRRWPEVDIICSTIPDSEKKANKYRKTGKQWWIYPNSTLFTKNRAYTRYVFGFGAWRWGVDGVVPWTFQMSQGCNGNPFTVLDGEEVMAAYPGVDGPVSTPTWEIIREGINDYKYIYLLEKLITAAKIENNPAAFFIEKKLEKFKKGLGQAPGNDDDSLGDWPLESFSKKRNQIIEWALELYQSKP